MKAIGIITARGGSKGIPNKNLFPLAGKPLISWTIEASLTSQSLTRCVVSTDSEEIAAVARASGAEVPFMRPAALARDDTPGILPVIHALQTLIPEMTEPPDVIVLLQPTSPLRTAADIDRAIDMFAREDADSLVSVVRANRHPYWALGMDESGWVTGLSGMTLRELQTRYPRRQDMPPAYYENGALYMAEPRVILEARSFYGERLLGMEMPAERSIDIDTREDMEFAEMYLRRSLT